MTDLVERLRDPYVVLTSMVVRLEAADEIERLRGLLKACSDDLASELETRYGGTQDLYTPMQRRYERDMQTVLDARAALEGKP